MIAPVPQALTNIAQILTGILRHYATVLMATTPKKQDARALREQRSLMRGMTLRQNASVLSSASFQARKNYLVSAFQSGAFLKDPQSKGQPPANPMTDPAGMEAMMGMMKGNMAMMIPQTLIMSWINAFFAGFVIRMFTLFPGVERDRAEGLICRSEAPVPAYDSLQVDAAVRSCYERS